MPLAGRFIVEQNIETGGLSMTRAIRTALAFCMTLSIGIGAASAQPRPNRPTTRPAAGGSAAGMGRTLLMIRLEQVKKIVGELGLSEDQKAKIDAIISDSE